MTDRALDWEEIPEDVTGDLTRNDRFSSLLVILVVVALFSLGITNRGRISGQSWQYTNREAGIEATYPAGWITDESGEWVVRILDPKARPFKSQFQVQIMPAGGQTSIRNVLDGLSLQRSSELSAYRVLSTEETEINGVAVTQMTFVFVDSDPNPFVQRLPVVVNGLDYLIRDGERVIVVTHTAQEAEFDENFELFFRFLTTLRY